MVHRLSLRQARRVAVAAQLLEAQRPADVVEVVEQLTVVKIDPVAAIAPSEHLTLFSRIGPAYEPEQLRRAMEDDRMLFELDGMIRPVSDLPLLLPGMRSWPPWQDVRDWLDANTGFQRDIFDLLEAEGPLPAAAIPDTSTVPWRSSGWTNNRNVTKMLESLALRGQVAITGREGRNRLWDLPERVYPQRLPELPAEVATRMRHERRLRSLGIARPRTTSQPGEPIDVGQAGEPAIVEGVAGQWRVDPEALDRPFSPRTALLSPMDRMVFDRQRLLDLFGFEYVLEMYKPKAQRRWGYFALPILRADRFIGKLDATANRSAGVLEVHAIHEDVPFTLGIEAEVHAEIAELAEWLGLDVSGLS